MSHRIVGLLGLVCMLATLTSVSLAQEKEAKPSTKAKGRLPAHYKDVVSEEQKQSIYAIQTKYGEQIRKLAEEMKAVTAQRDAEIEAVLSAEQKAKVETLKAEVKKKPAPPAATDTLKTETASEEAPAAKTPAKSSTTTKTSAK